MKIYINVDKITGGVGCITFRLLVFSKADVINKEQRFYGIGNNRKMQLLSLQTQAIWIHIDIRH